eukprot:TRINITY_DN16029_c0_g4_i2.p1 TRINITY_DN16029_c0_g4~~TRINITY_DN16029_c0_g4_i2.p1  ORF type:complete len:122 (+),score=8.98 TRINITY_DN16029_c0_g4_i2:120-485(+)
MSFLLRLHIRPVRFFSSSSSKAKPERKSDPNHNNTHQSMDGGGAHECGLESACVPVRDMLMGDVADWISHHQWTVPKPDIPPTRSEQSRLLPVDAPAPERDIATNHLRIPSLPFEPDSSWA